jgi:hypothetical protein
MKKYYRESKRRGISHIQLKKRKANWIGHIWRRNCFPKLFIEGKEGRVGVTGRRRGKRKQLLDDLK